MTTLLVVCRYNEDVSWVKNISQPYIIFNKGEQDIHDPNVVVQKNIGREEYTYLKYIVDNYHSLPDRIIFSQGHPLQHSPDFIELLKYEHLFGPVQPLSDRYDDNSKSDVRHISSPYLNINNLSVHIDFFDYRLRILCRDYKDDMGHWRLRQIFRKIYRSEFNIRKLAMKTVDLNFRTFNDMEVTPFNYSAIFAVNKERILYRPLSYYQNLLDKSIKQIALFPFIMEMSWMEIFQYDPPKEIYPCKNLIT